MEKSTRYSALPGGSAMGYRLGGWAGAGLMVSTLLVISPAARAETLSAWQFDPATQQLTLTLPSGVTPQYSVDTEAARIVLTLPQTQLGAVPTQQAYAGAVRQVSVSQVEADTVVVLELAPGAAIAPPGASLVAIAPAAEAGAAGAATDQTRWVLTALATPAGAAAPQAAAPSTMIVEMPMLPSSDPRLGFPAAGTGRLSTSAANLMLPSDIDNLANLPETLPVDPFNLGQPGEQVSVPSLAELDAVVGPVAAAPAAAVPSGPTVPSVAGSATAPPAASAPVISLEPPSAGASAASVAPPAAEPAPVAAVPAAPIDSETSGVPIAVTPPSAPATPAAPAVPAAPATPALPSPEQPALPPVVAVDPPALAPSQPATATVIAADPPALPDLAEASASQPSQPDAIAQEPPPVATVPVQLDSTLLAVPNAPNTTTQGTVLPPDTAIEVAAAGEPILFGRPLPGGAQAANPGAVGAPPAESPLSPDTLVAAGTVLELRYVGNEPLDLNTGSSQNQVLLLAQDIRDPITNGIVAPAGSQLIGQFEPTPQGQRWVSKMLIAPAGQQVAFASTSEYLVGSPEINPPRVAAGAGVGALALLLLTGFSGIGLVGGALVGATTMVGTSPQHIVLEPNQLIQVQVIQDIPRAIPIAAAPEHSREWGIGGW